MIKSGKNKLALAVVGAAALAVAGLGTAGIKNTRHNLGSSATADGENNNHTSATGEICVFCHTPHDASNKDGAGNLVSVPLWNRSLPASSSYTTYDQLGTSSLDGAVVDVGSVSIACLSCHDGQTAMDVMINEPGSGAVSIASSGAWSGTSVNGATGPTFNTSFGVSFIGTDLTNDHPIGIQYAGGGSTGSDTAGVFTGTYKDPDFKNAYKINKVDGVPVWFVPTYDVAGNAADVGVEATGGTGASGATRGKTDAVTSRNKTDIQLYTRMMASLSTNGEPADTAANAEPYVECASCHDPHSENTTFLRVDNFGSGVCLACHTK